MVKLLAISIVIYGVGGAAIASYLSGPAFASALAVGAGTILINVLGLAVFWRLIFSKKSIALAVSVIIFKYLFLAVILWSLWSAKAVNVLGFVVGLGSLLFAVLILPIAKKINSKLD